MKKFSVITILIFCFITVSSQSCLPDGIWFGSQAQIDSFQINYPGCTEILGNVTIYGGDIINLSGLIGITSIGGDFIIDRVDSLTCLDGLDSLILVQGHLDIGNFFHTGQHGNLSLSNINSLGNLISVGGHLGIYANSNLTSLEGLNQLTSIGDDLLIIENPALVNLYGLNNLISIGGSLLICFNPLNNLTGFDSLNSIEGDLLILGMSNLTSLTGLENLTTINGELQIGGWNPGYGGNPLLTSLSGLNNVSAESIVDLTIKYNHSLSFCDIQSICDYLIAPNGEVSIAANAPGCNSPEEVQDSCEANVGYIDMKFSKDDIFIYPNPASQELNISAEGFNIDEVEIYTLTGQKVFNVTPKSETIDISPLPPGMYIVEVTVEVRKVRRKLLVER